VNPSAEWIDHNGVLLRTGSPVLTAGNRGFRYGDGLFETLLVRNGRIRLRDRHFARLFAGIHRLRFAIPSHFTPGFLEQGILRLCERNGHAGLARVRLVVYRGDGGLYDPQEPDPAYLIESWPINPTEMEWNDQGLAVDIYPEGRKSCDALANLKSNNFLLYVLAALHARAHGLNDCLVLNTHQRIADSTIANVFFIKDRAVYTPPLPEAGVAGVMRDFLLSALPGAGFPVHERPVMAEELLGADEVFLTNAIKGIRWVGVFRTSRYRGTLSKAIYDQLVKPLV
jgi:branched-chain amino acid aminotransferase